MSLIIPFLSLPQLVIVRPQERVLESGVDRRCVFFLPPALPFHSSNTENGIKSILATEGIESSSMKVKPNLTI